jgi:hypothetical protein
LSDGITVTNRSGDNHPDNVIASLKADIDHLQKKIKDLEEKIEIADIAPDSMAMMILDLKRKLAARDKELEEWPDQVSDAIGPNYANRDGEDVLTQVTRVITNLEKEVEAALACSTKSGQLHGEVLDKLRLAEEFGMVFGILKSSDCPEGKMAFDVRRGSELWRLELEVADNVEARIAVDDFLDHLRRIKELKRSFVMSDPPWPMHNGDGYVLPKEVIDNLEPLLESLGESTPHAMGRGLGAAIVAWLKKESKEKGTTIQQEAEKVFGKKLEKPDDGVKCPACDGRLTPAGQEHCHLCHGKRIVFRFIAEKYTGKGKKDG